MRIHLHLPRLASCLFWPIAKSGIMAKRAPPNRERQKCCSARKHGRGGTRPSNLQPRKAPFLRSRYVTSTSYDSTSPGVVTFSPSGARGNVALRSFLKPKIRDHTLANSQTGGNDRRRERMGLQGTQRPHGAFQNMMAENTL